MENKDTAKKPVWSPSIEKISKSNMFVFKNYLNRRYTLQLNDYKDMYDWSCKYYDKFWEAIWHYSEIYYTKKYTKITDGNFPSYLKVPRPKWFIGAELNFAENLLKYRDEENAIIFQTEDKEPIHITYKELYDKVAKVTHSFRELGLVAGDRVAAYTTNCPEAIIAMLATSSIGAIWSSCSPDFGYQGIIDRFGQIEPKILIAVNGYSYNGKKFNTNDKISNIVKSLPDLTKCITISAIDENCLSGEKFITWENLLENEAEEVAFEQLPFDHPLYIMYSSGTTGVPKCIVHGQGGTLLQHYKELFLHTDLKRGEVISYFTTCGWMMWNWLVSSLYVGATIYLFDGSPAYPDMEVLWKAVQDHKINVFGTSPKYLTGCQKAGITPKDEFNLLSLRTILSTGSPCSRDNFAWVSKNVSSNVQLSSISGGTDIISCFMLGNPMLPVYSEEIQCRGLGMKVEALNNEGNIVLFEKGELVCFNPFPSMPLHFWNDEDFSKYYNAYFSKNKGLWTHGDYIMITQKDGIVVFGRSDATLNPGGVRIGTAEIYRIVEGMEVVKDSIVVGQKWQNDTRVCLFVVLQDGAVLTEELTQEIMDRIRSGATFRHVPNIIKQVSEIPVTISGKKVELAVTQILNGEQVLNESALSNPNALNEFREMKFS
jgi:acetoacetyl-CoA synthetase